MTINIGEVIAVDGMKITIRMFDDSNKETLYYEGQKYKGISIREYISIQRGFRDVVCIIEGEFLDEKKFLEEENKTYFVRRVEAKPIGYIEDGRFYEGIKFLPMIKDIASLINEKTISLIFSRNPLDGFTIGKMLKEEIPISLPWQKLFNTHIGIFGNTGSGKSNTLTKLFTVLFERKINEIRGKSTFAILDFNGEYTGEQFVKASDKKVLVLDTTANEKGKFPLGSAEFWNQETLAILFQAAANTQRPFLIRIITGRAKYVQSTDSLTHYIKSTFRSVFSSATPKRETLDLLRRIASILNAQPIIALLKDIIWHSGQEKFVMPPNTYFEANGIGFETRLSTHVGAMDCSGIDDFDELVIRTNLQLIRDLLNGYVQFEHIQPLLKRMEASLVSLKKVITISAENEAPKLLTVISMRKCNQEIKKILPLLIAKHYYHQHKNSVSNPPDKTMHLIIDEAHNILSEQSSREQESWKDYRLELFEEIIKEGRKFGMYLTLSSQRPADISPTIVSQLHNFFIHRLVNDRDLYLLDNTISTLDKISRNLIPNLSKGCCIVTGTSFELPMTLQVDILEEKKQPDSEDVNLTKLWSTN